MSSLGAAGVDDVFPMILGYLFWVVGVWCILYFALEVGRGQEVEVRGWRWKKLLAFVLTCADAVCLSVEFEQII